MLHGLVFFRQDAAYHQCDDRVRNRHRHRQFHVLWRPKPGPGCARLCRLDDSEGRFLFTLPSVIIQPASGAWLMWQGGFLWNDYWLTVTYGLYLLAAICWIPVVLIQIRMKGLLEQQSRGETFDAVAYAKLFRLWLRWVGPLSAVLSSSSGSW